MEFVFAGLVETVLRQGRCAQTAVADCHRKKDKRWMFANGETVEGAMERKSPA
jgi:hypothetical protein